MATTDQERYKALLPYLLRPFPLQLVRFKPQAESRGDKQGVKRVIALPYVNERHYFERLDLLVPGEWDVDYFQLGPKFACAITVVGVRRTDFNVSDDTMNAAAQALKRAMSMHGIGRFFYLLPKLWAEYDYSKRRFVKREEELAWELYRSGNLLTAQGKVFTPDLPYFDFHQPTTAQAVVTVEDAAVPNPIDEEVEGDLVSGVSDDADVPDAEPAPSDPAAAAPSDATTTEEDDLFPMVQTDTAAIPFYRSNRVVPIPTADHPLAKDLQYRLLDMHGTLDKTRWLWTPDDTAYRVAVGMQKLFGSRGGVTTDDLAAFTASLFEGRMGWLTHEGSHWFFVPLPMWNVVDDLRRSRPQETVAAMHAIFDAWQQAAPRADTNPVTGEIDRSTDPLPADIPAAAKAFAADHPDLAETVGVKPNDFAKFFDRAWADTYPDDTRVRMDRYRTLPDKQALYDLISEYAATLVAA